MVTRTDYFAAALDVLATRGHGALRIGSLCTAIGVTTGSFYHYFGSWDGFVEELLAHWEQQTTQRIVALAAAEADPVARVHKIKKLALTLPHEAETAIRAWAHSNPIVARAQARVDEERLDAVRSVLLGVLPGRREAEQLAVLGLSLLIGVQQWRCPVDVKELGRLLDVYEQLVIGRAGVLTG